VIAEQQFERGVSAAPTKAAEIAGESEPFRDEGSALTALGRDTAHDARWREVLARLDLAGAKLVQARPERPGQRTYVAGRMVYKMYLVGSAPGDEERADRLRRGFEMVRRCADIGAVPRAMWERREAGVQVCAYATVPGARPIDSPAFGIFRTAAGMAQLARVLCQLSWRGIAHNDLFPSNVIIGANGRCYLIDFDSATHETRFRAFWRNFVRGRAKLRDGQPKWSFAKLAKALLIRHISRWSPKGRLKHS